MYERLFQACHIVVTDFAHRRYPEQTGSHITLPGIDNKAQLFQTIMQLIVGQTVRQVIATQYTGTLLCRQPRFDGQVLQVSATRAASFR